MPVKRFKKLRQYLHFVDNSLGNTENDKLFKVKPILDAIRAEWEKIEPEEYFSIDGQIVPSKTKRSKYGNTIQKDQNNGDLKILFVREVNQAWITIFIFNLKICKNVYTLLLNFQRGTTLALLHFLKSKQVCAVGTIRANWLPAYCQ